MNENNTEQKRGGYAFGFSTYTDEQFRTISDELKLNMSVGELKYCAKYYKSCHLHDPSIEELCFISKMVRLFRSAPHTLTPYNFISDDSEIFETYRDLAEKYEVLFGDRGCPMTYSNAVCIADEYLKYAGKESILPYNVELTALGNAELISNQSLSLCKIGTGKISVIQKHSKKAKIQNNDFYACIYGDEKAVNETVKKLIEEETVSLAESVGKYGLLYSLLRMSEGLNINTAAVAELFGESNRDDTSLLELFCKTPSLPSFAVRIPRVDAKLVSDAIEETDAVELKFIGIADKSENFTARRGDNTVIISVLMSFLRSLNFLCHIEDKIGNVSYDRPELPSYSLCDSFSVEKYRYLYVESTVDLDMPYIGAMYGVLDAFGKLLEKGCDKDKTEVFASYDYPNVYDRRDFYTCGEGLAAILGIYRAKAELSIGGKASCEFNDSTIPNVLIEAYAEAPKNPICNKFSECAGEVYLLETSYILGRLPDFENLRALTRYLRKLTAEKAISAIKYIGGISIKDFAKENGILLNEGIDSDYVPGFAFAVKTESEILGVPFGKVLGV